MALTAYNNTNSDTLSSSPKLKISAMYHYLISHAMYLFLIPALLSAAIHHLGPHMNNNSSATTGIIVFLLLLAAAVLLRRKKVYLVDFACYNHDPSFHVSREEIYARASGLLTPETMAFLRKVMERSGISEEVFVYGFRDFPPESAFECGREEAEVVIRGAVGDLLKKTGVDSREIGVVVVNISTFNPVPSLSAMIVNRFKLREDVLSYTLGGMGCSAGVIAVDLAKRLLQVQRNTYALIVSLESPTSSYYLGDDKSKILSNCLFRMGGAAVLLSNRPSDRRSSKYELTHTLRTHLGSDDIAYNCVRQEEDDARKLGVSVSKNLISIAGKALKSNITALGPSVLPVSEQIRFFATLLARKLFGIKGLNPYIPDFKLAFEHFCIHAGGKAVLDEVEKNLKLTEWDMELSRMTLYRYGNTSSSSLWYELAYAEAKGRIKKGDRVWQVGFGSGFKCASGVWRALRTISPDEESNNPWTDVIDQFPVSMRA